MTRKQSTALTKTFLSEILSEARNKYKVPAIAVTVMDQESAYLQKIQGVRVSDRPPRATMDDFFHIGSCSKSILALIAAKLIEQGQLTWKTRFFDVFDELKANAKDAYGEITLEDLFLCEAGIKAYTNAAAEPFPDYEPSVGDRRMEFVKDLIAQPPASGKKGGRFRHLYSNASYTVATVMLERVSGLKYEELLKGTLTDGLGLAFHIGWPNGMGPDQPWGHLIAKGEVHPFPPDHGYKLPHLIAPAGDLSMTPKDFAEYTRVHLRGLRGNGRYLSKEAFSHIHFGHAGFSIGVGNGKMGGKRYSVFDGSAGTFFCRSILCPESDFAFSIMMNAGSGTASMNAVEWLTMRIVKKRFNWWWMFWI